jgi:N,N'-diacetyllegionaminate synthase
MMHRKIVRIGDEKIGDGEATFIVAEAGINHNGDIALAKELIVAAKESGANAVKFQAFTAEKLCDLDLTETKDVAALTGGTKSSYAMYKELELSDHEIIALHTFAQKEGILFFVSVFDEARVDFLDSIGISCFKISSGDLTHVPLLEYAASKKRPMIISTGLATLDEVHRAVSGIEAAGNTEIIILHCTADYPPRDSEINLAALATLNKEFAYPIGYSDHSLGIEIPLAAAALRATMIEKHFTLDHDLDGPDHAMSADPGQLKQLVAAVRRIELARGSARKSPTEREKELVYSGRRGIKAARDIRAGQCLALEDLKIVKPASGIQPEHLMSLVGQKSHKEMKKNEPIEWSYLSKAE